MCCTCLIICWSNTKRFLSVLIVFGKCFCFENCQKFQKLYNPILATLPHESSKLWAYTKAPGSSLAGQGPSREKDLEKFQKSGFLGFLWLSLATSSQVEALVVRFTQNDSQLPSQLTRKWTFQSWKTFRRIFQNLSHGFLAT